MRKWMMFLFSAVVFAMMAAGCNRVPTPQDRFAQYVALWNQQKFANMYDFLSVDAKKTVSKQEFVSRYHKIYSDLGVAHLKIQFTKPKKDSPALSYTTSMDTITGAIHFTHTAQLKKENDNWFVNWDSTYIFPQLKAGDKVGITTTPPVRGQILDRNGKGMAVNGQVYEVGVIPGKMGAQKDYVIHQLASLLQMDPAQINSQSVRHGSNPISLFRSSRFRCRIKLGLPSW